MRKNKSSKKRREMKTWPRWRWKWPRCVSRSNVMTCPQTNDHTPIYIHSFVHHFHSKKSFSFSSTNPSGAVFPNRHLLLTAFGPRYFLPVSTISLKEAVLSASLKLSYSSLVYPLNIWETPSFWGILTRSTSPNCFILASSRVKSSIVSLESNCSTLWSKTANV